MTLITDPKQK